MDSDFATNYSLVSSTIESYIPSLKTPKTESIESDYQLPAILPISEPTKRFKQMGPPPLPSSSTQQQQRKRRKTIGESIRTLEKIVPWEKKMNTPTILGETYKYIKFLQAQVSVLQSMPGLTSMDSSCDGGDNGFGGLEKLNRQQLLQVLMNCDAAQTVLADKGSCVYSLEQVLLLNSNLMEKMMMFGPWRN